MSWVTWLVVGAVLAMVVGGFAYAWRNRPSRDPGIDEPWRDEMAYRANKYAERQGDFGASVRNDL